MTLRHNPESLNPIKLWMPDQIRHDEGSLFNCRVYTIRSIITIALDRSLFILINQRPVRAKTNNVFIIYRILRFICIYISIMLILFPMENIPTPFLLSCKTILNRFMDIIYPPRCHICQDFFGSNRKKEQLICDQCRADFTQIISPLCPICSQTFDSQVEDDHLCEACLRIPPHYDALRAPFSYKGGIMEAIHQFKYGGKTYLARSLGPLLASFAFEWLGKTDGLLIIPVPLHSKKIRKRGFNQSHLLAKRIQSHLGAELDFLSLRRISNTLPQTGLRRSERRKNVQGAFSINGKKDFKGRTILLVDDVATTTSTLNECARVLKKAGCEKVFCLVLARALG